MLTMGKKKIALADSKGVCLLVGDETVTSFQGFSWVSVEVLPC